MSSAAIVQAVGLKAVLPLEQLVVLSGPFDKTLGQKEYEPKG